MYNAKVKKVSKKGHNSAVSSLTEKKKYGSAYFSCLFHVSNFKILSLTVHDRTQSVTDAQTDRPKPIWSQYAPSTSLKLGL